LLKYIKNYIITFRYIKLFSYWNARYLHNKLKEERIRESQNLHNPHKEKHKYYYILQMIIKKLFQIINKIISLTPLGRKLSSYITEKYSQYKQKEKKPKKIYNRYTYYYGLQIIIGGINKFLLLIIPGLLFNILPQLLLTTLSFVSLRIWTGGLHYNSYTKCSYISLLSFTLTALLSKYIILNQFITMSIFLSVFILILIYAPVEHPNRPIKEKEKIKYKLIALFVLSTLTIIYMFTNNVIICNSIIYGILLAGIIMLPIINKLR